MSKSYNDAVTHNYGLGPFATTRGVIYEQWRQMQAPETWGTLTFDEWARAAPSGQMMSWSEWVEINRPALWPNGE